MLADELQGTNERIERLERNLRRQNRGLIGFAILAVATSLLIGQTPSRRTVEAEEFILRGPQGQELATLDGAGTGAALALYDSQHRLRLVLRSDASFSAINLLDSGERVHIALLSSDAHGPAAVLTGSDLKSSASVAVLNNSPNIQLHDDEGRIRADFGLTELGPLMRVYDSHSDTRAAFGISEEVPMVTVGGPAGKGGVMMSAGGTGKGSTKRVMGGIIIVTGPDGKSRNVTR
jgi:hypothetical protein